VEEDGAAVVGELHECVEFRRGEALGGGRDDDGVRAVEIVDEGTGAFDEVPVVFGVTGERTHLVGVEELVVAFVPEDGAGADELVPDVEDELLVVRGEVPATVDHDRAEADDVPAGGDEGGGAVVGHDRAFVVGVVDPRRRFAPYGDDGVVRELGLARCVERTRGVELELHEPPVVFVRQALPLLGAFVLASLEELGRVDAKESDLLFRAVLEADGDGVRVSHLDDFAVASSADSCAISNGDFSAPATRSTRRDAGCAHEAGGNRAEERPAMHMLQIVYIA